jgi:hypothetical protein
VNFPRPWQYGIFLAKRTIRDVLVETPRRTLAEIKGEDDDVVQEVHDFGGTTYGELASPYLKPSLSKDESLYNHYCIRRQNDKFTIGNATITIDKENNLTIKGKQFKGTRGLWEILTRKACIKK